MLSINSYLPSVNIRVAPTQQKIAPTDLPRVKAGVQAWRVYRKVSIVGGQHWKVRPHQLAGEVYNTNVGVVSSKFPACGNKQKN